MEAYNNKPYIYASYNREDFDLINPILSFLTMSGYRIEKDDDSYLETCCACLCFITQNYNQKDISYCLHHDIPVVSIVLEPVSMDILQYTTVIEKYVIGNDNAFYERLFRLSILYPALKGSSIEEIKEDVENTSVEEKPHGIFSKLLLVFIVVFISVFSVFLYKKLTTPTIEQVIEEEKVTPPVSDATKFETMNYLYDSLTDNQKLFYDDMYRAASQDEMHFISVSMSEEDWKNTVDAFYYDHPEFFWIEDAEGILYNDYSEITFIYYFEDDELEEAKLKYNQKVNSIVQACQNLNDIEKIKYVYDYLISKTTYEEGSPMNQSSYSALVLGKSVCAGYVKSMKVLFDQLQIRAGSVILNPLGVEVGHALNIVEIDNDYYYIDSTWGNQLNGKYPYIDYGYLLFNSKQFESNYLENGKYTIAYSYETSSSDDYTLYYVCPLPGFDKERMAYYMDKSMEEGSSYVQFYVEDIDDFIKVINDGQSMYSVFSEVGLNKTKFTYNVKGNVCTIFL